MKGLRMKTGLLLLCLLLIVPALAAAKPQSVTGPTQDLRSKLGQLLGEHAVLSVIAMQRGYDNVSGLTQSVDTWKQNTSGLAAVIASVYGDNAGQTFESLWGSHIDYLVNYAKATASNDEEGRRQAMASLEVYRVKQAEFFSDVNSSYFDKDRIASDLQLHISRIIAALDAYAKKDYPAVYENTRQAYSNMFMTGDALALGISNQYKSNYPAFKENADASDLRSKLGQLLGEHALLTVITMQKSADQAPDANAASAALASNTNELSDAIAQVYDNANGETFKSLWGSHISYLIDYSKATLAGSVDGRAKAVDELEKYRMAQAKFFAAANPYYFKESEIAAGLKVHIDHLILGINKYVQKDYEMAFDGLHAAYAHMFMTADTLASGIVAQFNYQVPETEETRPPAPEQSTVTMKVGSKTIKNDVSAFTMDVVPYVSEGITYIPVRYMAQSIGAYVEWTPKTMTATIRSGSDTAVFWAGQPKMSFNGVVRTVGAYARVKDDRLFVPVRFIAELYGWKVEYNKKDWTITLKKMLP
ncbi:copper amine oxidase N-terminal domain-containing protein [Paenibacillus oenotherae]|uniref:Copper amine oxidase N-terminal domain-containing protein n=1 Tax=Paenibacillus oenotherae TaxID=1435645 RepID=A0ABS7D8X7_9BACL|nr:copper amine oxidase N-terminal domain-containing protein [Paenibacillus oenotherae]MBW7476407.1 copper amine oxidase N-terminal domain-containing protein [Paenibacillus oenotherae]